MDVNRAVGTVPVVRVAALLAVVAAVVFGLELLARASLPGAAFDSAVAVLVVVLLVAIYNSISGYRTGPG